MKKISLIFAILIAFTLVFAGCPGEGDKGTPPPVIPGGPGEGPGGEATGLAAIFTATATTQDKATVTVGEGTATFAFKAGTTELWGELVAPEATPWDASSFTGIKFEYKATGSVTIFIQDTNTIYIFGLNDSNGWGAVMEADIWTAIELPFSIAKLPDNDGTTGWFGENKPFDKSAIIKLAFQISPASTGEKFELQNFTAY